MSSPVPAASQGSVIPSFEGVAVTATESLITGKASIQHPGDLVVSIDDIVRMVGEYRVVSVNFKVDPKTGETVRVQTLKPVRIETVPWNAADPTDDGITRARPGTP